ncbi:MAG TPA: tRNA-binding protein [Chitinophagaceae bacterium]|nr:tRNA-binding protein [Chitinophagaceae bacterium]
MPPQPVTARWEDFQKLDIRVGTILEAGDFPQAIVPAWKLKIDFGPLGIKSSCARITDLYRKEDLTGRQVIAVVNFPVKQIGPFYSDCLVLGITGENAPVVLLQPDRMVENGLRIG